MALIGYLGRDADNGIQFVVAREVFCTPKDMTWSGAARYATHERHATHALTEFAGLDPDRFSFDILLTAQLGIEPMKEIVKIWDFERKGEAVGLVIGGKEYGKYRWTVKKHETKIKYTDEAGDLYAAEVSVELLEYLKGESHNTSAVPQSGAYSAKPTAGTTSEGTGGGTTYTVKRGDCLWNIARKFYGSGAQYSKIYQANRSVIGNNPNLIYPGQVLTIPG